MKVFLNGQWIPLEEARISVLDRGLLFGDGVFETLRAYRGRLFQAEAHVARLAQSAQMVSIPLPYPPEEIHRILMETLQKNKLQEARVRITLTRGLGEPGRLLPPPEPSPTLFVLATSFPGHPPERYVRGYQVILASRVRQVPPAIFPSQAKTLNRLHLILARMEAQAQGADEALLLTPDGFVAEGTISNVFVVHEDHLLTPPLSLGILEGITRKEVLSLAREEGFPVTEQPFPPEILFQAQEVFLTSTTLEVMPVTRINGHPVGKGNPGPWTLRLLDRYRARVLGE